MTRRAMALLALATFLPATAVRADETVKIATLAPDGSSWMNVFRDWGREVLRRTQGRLRLRFYPGGVMGDERDVLRKIDSAASFRIYNRRWISC